MAAPSRRKKMTREKGWAVVDTGGTYQSKFCLHRGDAEYDQKKTAHIQDGHFVIRRATLTHWTPPRKPATRKGK